MQLSNFTESDRFTLLFSNWPLTLLISLSATLLLSSSAAADDYEILTRGPVHEAFAESVIYEPEPGVMVPHEPPALIEELPPEQRPAGDDVAWVPGYWGWDDESEDFLWISGVWRSVPGGRQWVPGYWDEVDSRYQWTSGYWANRELEQITYISSAPPRSVEAGPNVSPPDPSHLWNPGIWRWSDSRYTWRPGYWMEPRARQVWVPARYVWTRRGYVYVEGYWDYVVDDRGVLFAPVHFNRDVRIRSGYHFTPSVAVDLGVLTVHLFVRPRTSQYYFGDYYAPRYRDYGYQPNFIWHQKRRGYEPIFAYQSWYHRDDRNWYRSRETDYRFYVENDAYRPPHTWSVMQGLTNMKLKGDKDQRRLLANSYNHLVKSRSSVAGYKTVEPEFREAVSQQNAGFKEVAKTRRLNEREKRPSKGAVASASLPPSPIASRSSASDRGKKVSQEKGQAQNMKKTGEKQKDLASKDSKQPSNKANDAGREKKPDKGVSQRDPNSKGQKGDAKATKTEPKRPTKTEQPSASRKAEPSKAKPQPKAPAKQPDKSAQPEKTRKPEKATQPTRQKQPSKPKAQPQPRAKSEPNAKGPSKSKQPVVRETPKREAPQQQRGGNSGAAQKGGGKGKKK